MSDTSGPTAEEVLRLYRQLNPTDQRWVLTELSAEVDARQSPSGVWMKASAAARLLGKSLAQVTRDVRNRKLVGNGAPRHQYRVHRASVALMMLDLWRWHFVRGEGFRLVCEQALETAIARYLPAWEAIVDLLPFAAQGFAVEHYARPRRGKAVLKPRRTRELPPMPGSLRDLAEWWAEVEAKRREVQEQLLSPQREELMRIRIVLEKIGAPANEALTALDDLTAALLPAP